MPTATILRDSAYAGLGFAVLGVRQASEALSDLEKRVGRSEKVRESVDAFRGKVEERTAPYTDRVQARLDGLVARLPEAARKTYQEAVNAGKQVSAELEKLGRTIRDERPDTPPS